MNVWKNKNIFITGGGSGIGLSIVKCALEHGAKVSTMVRRQSQELNALQDKNLHIELGSVGNRSHVKNWIERGLKNFLTIDVLINNAGAMFYMPIDLPNYDQMKETIETNCMGMVNLIDSALAHLLKSESPYWINLSSDAAKVAFPGLAVYSGSKAFVQLTSNAMRQELFGKNLKVTNLQPGNIATNLHHKSTNKEALKEYGTENKGQYLKTQDIVSSIEYLLSTPHQVAVNELLIEPLTESI